jgi:hypothetical protein
LAVDCTVIFGGDEAVEELIGDATAGDATAGAVNHAQASVILGLLLDGQQTGARRGQFIQHALRQIHMPSRLKGAHMSHLAVGGRSDDFRIGFEPRNP